MLVGTTASIVSSGENLLDSNSIGAFAQFSDGTARFVEATWTSSDTSIIRIDGRQAFALSHGTANVTATYQGLTASFEFLVERGVPGRWSGSYVVRECDGTSVAVREAVCNPPGNLRPRGLAPVGLTAPFGAEISERGDDLAAAVTFGFVSGNLPGARYGRSAFELQGQIETGGWLLYTSVGGVVNGDTFDGSILYQVILPNLPGYATVLGRLTMTR